MASGWFVFTVVGGIILCTGCILAVAILRAAWQQRERESLTSSDLRALEESALYLVEHLRTEAEAATGELESKCAVLTDLIATAEERIGTLRELSASIASRTAVRESPEALACNMPQPSLDPVRQEILALAGSGMDCSEIARRSGVDCAEVKLVLRFAGISPH